MNATAIKERPIIFSGPMVRAILEGRKTQTRRIAKGVDGYADVCRVIDPDAGPFWRFSITDNSGGIRATACHNIDCPYGQPGDRLWVREAWQSRSMVGWSPNRGEQEADWIEYKADYLSPAPGKWRSPMHMPRQASRITLEITEVRVQRLQDAGHRDLTAEGWPGSLEDRAYCEAMDDGNDAVIEWYADLWNSINGPGSWNANPWVWAITFKRVEGGGQ